MYAGAGLLLPIYVGLMLALTTGLGLLFAVQLVGLGRFAPASFTSIQSPFVACAKRGALIGLIWSFFVIGAMFFDSSKHTHTYIWAVRLSMPIWLFVFYPLAYGCVANPTFTLAKKRLIAFAVTAAPLAFAFLLATAFSWKATR